MLPTIIVVEFSYLLHIVLFDVLLTRQKEVEDRMWCTSVERSSWVSGRREQLQVQE